MFIALNMKLINIKNEQHKALKKLAIDKGIKLIEASEIVIAKGLKEAKNPSVKKD